MEEIGLRMPSPGTEEERVDQGAGVEMGLAHEGAEGRRAAETAQAGDGEFHGTSLRGRREKRVLRLGRRMTAGMGVESHSSRWSRDEWGTGLGTGLGTGREWDCRYTVGEGWEVRAFHSSLEAAGPSTQRV